MAIKVSCPLCDATISVSDRSSGRRAKCPKCTEYFLVPQNGSGKNAFQNTDAGQEPEVVVQIEPTDEKPKPITFDMLPPVPKTADIYQPPAKRPDSDPDIDVNRKKKKNKKSKSSAPAKPITEKKGIHPGFILGGLCFVLLLAILLGVWRWNSFAQASSGQNQASSIGKSE
jgi:hypothetical protein